MTRQEIEQKVVEIVSITLSVPKEKLSLDTSLIKDLSADSLMILDVMLKCEDTFELTISDEDTEKIKTIGDAVDYIHANMSAK